jgi:hypothetical protein
MRPHEDLRRFACLLTASFSGRDPHRMMHVYGLCKGPVCLAEGVSKRGRVSIDATCCELRWADRW